MIMCHRTSQPLLRLDAPPPTGWLLTNDPYADRESVEEYENEQLIEAALLRGLLLKRVCARQVDMTLHSTTIHDRDIVLDDKRTPLPDLLLVRTGALTDPRTMVLIKFLECLGVKTFPTSQGIEWTQNKFYTHLRLAACGIPTPATTILNINEYDIERIGREIGWPAIVKVASGTQGQGVFLLDDPDALKDRIEWLQLASNPSDVPILLIQRYIGSSHGRDIRAFVIGGRVVGCMERRAVDSDHRANCSIGGLGVPLDISPMIADLALTSAEAVGLGIAGVDLLFAENSLTVCEVNSAPGFRALTAAHGVDLDIAGQIVDCMLAPSMCAASSEARCGAPHSKNDSIAPNAMKKTGDIDSPSLTHEDEEPRRRWA